MYEYHGGFFKGLKHGVGVEIFRDGLTYLGDMEDDQRHGQGILIENSTGESPKIIYRGFWNQG